MDMNSEEFKLLCSNCWQTKYQPIAIDMSKNINEGRYRKNLNKIYIPAIILFSFYK